MRFWGILKPFIPFIVIYFFIRDILLSISVGLVHHYVANPNLNALAEMALYTIFVAGVAIWYVKKNGCGEFLLLKNAKVFAAFSLLLAFSILCMKMIIFDGKISYYQLLIFRWLQVDSVGLTANTGTYIKIGSAIDSWGYAPIFESMVYLGLFQKQLSKKLSPYKAIVVAAVVFALLHFNLEKILITFTTGLLYGYLYYKTGKLIYPILCHSLNNLLSTFLVYTPQDINVESVVTLLVVAVCFAVSLRYVLRYRVRECAAAEKESALDEAKLQEKSKQI